MRFFIAAAAAPVVWSFVPVSPLVGTARTDVACAAVTGKGEGGAMGYSKLGDSDLSVSQICLGGMMFGLATDEEESHKLLDLAVDGHGVNLIDTAEGYPFPADPDRAGRSERIIGSWLAKRDRSSVIVATKVCGPSNIMPWMREDGSDTALTRQQIVEAVDGSLRRLKTDYIDLLQIHWPGRYVPSVAAECFDLSRATEGNFEEELMALQHVIESGKVRHIGVVNETPYGVLRFCEHAEWDDLPKIVSIQNEYNLLSRNRIELGLVETCSPKNCNVGLLAHSPIAGGALTGQYIGQRPVNMNHEARLNKFNGWQARYLNKACQEAIAEYKDLAMKHELPPAQLAVAWLLNRPHLTGVIVGATSEQQLEEQLGALKVDWTEELETDVHKTFARHREPSLSPAYA